MNSSSPPVSADLCYLSIVTGQEYSLQEVCYMAPFSQIGLFQPSAMTHVLLCQIFNALEI